MGQLNQYVQVAVDGAGKKVQMLVTTDGEGNTVYQQCAVLLGDTPDLLYQLVAHAKAQLAVSRAILATLSASSNAPYDEDRFTGQDPTEN